jgi:hypothetical protein
MNIEEYSKTYPYQEYNEMVEKIENNLAIWSEYSLINHECCKIIYENPNNKDLIVEMGQKIYKSGGLQSLRMNHNVIKYFSPYSQSTNNKIKKHIEEYFQDYKIF